MAFMWHMLELDARKLLELDTRKLRFEADITMAFMWLIYPQCTVRLVCCCQQQMHLKACLMYLKACQAQCGVYGADVPA